MQLRLISSMSSSSLLQSLEHKKNMMHHCSQLASAIQGEQWFDT